MTTETRSGRKKDKVCCTAVVEEMPSKRKSERLEKQSPLRKSETLRRSDRGKPSTSPVKMKSLIMDFQSPSLALKRDKMDARRYKAFFKTQRIRSNALEINESLERPKKSSRVDVDADSKLINADNESHGRVVKELIQEHPNGVASVRSISSLEPCDADASGNDVEEFPSRRCSSAEKSAAADLLADNSLQVSKSDCTGVISGDSEKVPEGCSMTRDNLQISGVACSSSTGGAFILEIGEQNLGKSSETHKNTCDLADVSPRPSLPNHDELAFGGTCASCSRRIRIDHDSPEEELCSCAGMLGRVYSKLSNVKDRVGSEASILSDSGEGCTIQLNEAPSVSQRDGDKKMCDICKLGGETLTCDGRGCKRCYHLSCLDPRLDDFPPGAWHCTWCAKKKIEYGVHSVTEGVESIVDVREVEVAGAKGIHKQKQYLVKYKGLAHAHNHWVAETQLLTDASQLIADYNHKNQDVRWNSEWTVPHRLLKKRLLMFSKLHGQEAGDNKNYLFEWLVKWRCLGYEYATWELGNASFLNSQHGESLIEDFNVRRKKAKRRIDKNHKAPFVKLSELSAGGSRVTDPNLLNNVNKLRECWLRCQNTAVFDAQDRILKMVLFILSLTDVCWPFLIVTTSSSISHWEAEFTRWAPNIDVVVYSGNKDSRRRIKSLEFYDEDGFVIFQVLLSSLEAVIEDVEILRGLSWEVIIIDDCQNIGISARAEQIKMLDTGVKVLLFNGPMKTTSSHSLTLLSLFDCKVGLDKTGGLESDFNDHLGISRGLSKAIAPNSKLESSKFVEYWVPVQISDLQLEQYCSTLLTNCDALRSFCKKSDPVGALGGILVSVRKCCDHPYLLDPSLQPFNKGLSHVQILEVGIKASGKLQLLDKMLLEMKLRQRRVVVLFQSIAGVAASIGDILDDFLRQRFGEDSYERVEMCVISSRKQASINRFNDLESGRFVLLLENRACHPSIKLSSVDSVIIYDTETNPTNDLKLLQRVSFDSQSKYTYIFRLYSCFTIEERALFLAKQDSNVDNNLNSISRSPNNTLMWGASSLFSRLDEYHSIGSPTSISNNSSGQLLSNDVISEFSAIISQSCDYKDTCNYIISKVQMNAGTYSANIPLLGEKNIELNVVEEPHIFWRKLLEGRNPQWRNLNIATPRNRKRVHYSDGFPGPANVNDEVGNKRRKVVNKSVDAIPTHPSTERGEVAASNTGPPIVNDVGNKRRKVVNHHSVDAIPIHPSTERGEVATNTGAHEDDDNGWEHVSRSPSHLLHEVDLVDPEGGHTPNNEQRSLHMHLKAEFAKLFEVLKLSEDVKHTVGKFLEYVMENLRLTRENSTILQAFQISLCWVAASILKQKVDKEETFLLAKQHLQFGCTKEEANDVYKKIRSLRKTFLQLLHQNYDSSNSSKFSLLAERSVVEEPSKGCTPNSVESPQPNVAVKCFPRECIVLPKEKLVDIEKENFIKEKLVDIGKENFIKEVQNRCDRRMSKLVQKQKAEMEEFQKIWEKKEEELEEDYRLQLAVLRSIYGQTAATKDRQKILETELSSKLKELKCCKDQHLKELEEEHTTMRNRETRKAACWLAQANTYRDLESDSTDYMQCSQENLNLSHGTPNSVRHESKHRVEELNAVNIVDSTRCDMVSDVPASTSEEPYTIPVDSTSVSAAPATEQVGIRSVDGALVAKSKQPCGIGDPDIPVSTSNESNIFSFDTTNFLTMPLTEVHVEISSMAGEFVARSKKPNEIGDSGGSSEDIGALTAISNQPNEVGGPDLPASISHESNIPVEHLNVKTSSVTEEQVKIASTAEPMVARSKLPNEVGDSGGGSQVIVNVFRPPPEEHTEVLLEDRNRECLFEVSETAFNVVLGNDPSEVNNVINELSTESNSLENNSHLTNDEENLRIAVSSTDGNQINTNELGVDLPLVAAVPSDDAGSLLHNQSSGYNEALTHELPLQENQSRRVVEVAGSNNFDPVSVNSSEQQLPASDDLSLASHDPQRDITHQTNTDESNFIPNLGSSCRLDGETVEPLQAGGIVEECPSVIVETSPLSRPNLSEVRGDPQPIAERVFSPNTETPAQVPGSEELPSPAVLHANTNVSFVQGPRNIAVNPAHQMATGNSSLHTNADPLQKEWERIHKEKEQTTKIHDDLKLHLISDCEKEIEEIIAQIRKKYDFKLQEAEAAFLWKKNELDMNQNKVLMNKILADAFRCKCMNLKPSGLAGMHHVVPSSNMHQQHQVSQQSSLRSSPVTGPSSASQQSSATACLRATSVTGLSSAGQAQAGQEISVPSLPVNRSVNSGGNSQPTFRCAPLTGLSVASQSAPTLQASPVTRSTGLSAGIPGRPLLIGSITPSTGNLRVAGDIRAPAPHLQPFRSPTSMTTNSPSTLGNNLPNQLLSTVAAPSTSRTQLASLQSASPRTQHQITPPFVPASVIDLSGSRNMTLHRDSELPATQSQPLSAQEVLLNVENPPHANRPSISPPLPEMASNFDTLDLSDFQTVDSVVGCSASTAIATTAIATNVSNVVCLSDEE